MTPIRSSLLRFFRPGTDRVTAEPPGRKSRSTRLRTLCERGGVVGGPLAKRSHARVKESVDDDAADPARRPGNEYGRNVCLIHAAHRNVTR